MANQRIAISSFMGGVSRQPDAIRHPTQLEEADNILFSVRNGAEKRPGSRLAFKLTGLTASANYRLHTIIRDETERYLMIYGAGTPNTLLRIFNPAGTEATVSVSTAAQAYLNSGSPTADQLRPITIADYTLMLNTTVVLAAKTSANYTIAKSHRDFDTMISHTPGFGTYHKTKADTAARTAGYFIYGEYGSFDGSFATWHRNAASYTLTDFSTVAHNPGGFRVDFIRHPMLLTAVTWTLATKTLTKTGAFSAYTWYANDQIYISGGSGPAAGWYNIASKQSSDIIVLDTTSTAANAVDVTTTNIGHEYEVLADMQNAALTDHHDVALQFQDALRAAGCTDGLIEWTYTGGSSTGYFTITSPYRGIWDGVNGVSIAAPLAPTSGYSYVDGADLKPFAATSPVTTVGTATGLDTPTFPVLRRWRRKPPPNQPAAEIDETTMPIKIVRTSLGPPVQFTVSMIATGEGVAKADGTYDRWGFRESGDEETNPTPSLWKEGLKLSDISFHRNRLVLAGDENVVFSQAGDFFKFYIEDFDNIGDADPIDIALSAEEVTLVEFIVPFRKSLVIFTKSGRQFDLNAPETLTPSTAAITPSTNYHTKLGVRPAVLGDALYFAAEQSGKTQLLEYFYSDTEVANIAADISAHVDGYLPTDIKTIRTILNNDTVLLLPKGTTEDNNFYIYRFYWGQDAQGNTRRQQSAWGKYIFHQDERIADIGIVGPDCYALVENSLGYFVTYLSVPPEPPDTDYPWDVHLDNMQSLTGSYAGGYTTWTLGAPDITINRAVLGPAFSDNVGTVLTLTTIDSTHVRVSGDYHLGVALIGRMFLMNGELSRPYVRDQNGASILDMVLLLNKFVLNHKNTGSYAIRVEQPLRAARDYAFVPRDGSAVEAEGSHHAYVMGNSADTTISVRDESAYPAIISSAEFIGTFVQRSM